MSGDEIFSYGRDEAYGQQAAAVAINPSRTTGQRRAAAPRMIPARPPISKPPTFGNTSSASSAWVVSVECLP